MGVFVISLEKIAQIPQNVTFNSLFTTNINLTQIKEFIDIKNNIKKLDK